MSVSDVVSLWSCYSDPLVVNKYAPSFPPTSIDYFPYPWRGTDGSGSNKDEQEQNALSYLMTSNFATPPAEGAIPYTGPWTDVGSRDASFCMSANLFWGWLHPLMRKIAMAMTPIPDEPYLEYIGTPEDTPWRFGERSHVGVSNASDDDYVWVYDGGNSWKTSSYVTPTKKTTSNPHYKDDYETVQEKSMFKSQLRFSHSNRS